MTRCAAVCFAPAAGAFRAPLSLSLAAPDSQLRLRSDRPPAAAAIQAYVECNLMHDTATYKVPLAEGNNSEDVAMWPVTPYTLTLANHDRTTDVWATLYVDGCKISKHFIERGGSKEIEGIDDGMSTKELLFSFPRLMTSECVLRLPAERAHARASVPADRPLRCSAACAIPQARQAREGAPVAGRRDQGGGDTRDILEEGDPQGRRRFLRSVRALQQHSCLCLCRRD